MQEDTMERTAKDIDERLRRLETSQAEQTSLLKKIRHVQKRRFFTNMLYWVIIIGFALGSFYFIQPYVERVNDVYQTILGV